MPRGKEYSVFIDTILLCTLTALVVIVNFNEIKLNNSWLSLTFEAYSITLGAFAKIFLSIAVLSFGFATILCWGHYGIESVYSLSKKGYLKKIFIFVYCSSVILGALFSPEFIWSVADLAIGVMSVINIAALIMARREIKEETEIFLSDVNKANKKQKNAKNISKKC